MAHVLAVRISERYLKEETIEENTLISLPFTFELYTFGAQRMCNKPFQRWTRYILLQVPQVTAYRFVDELDIVPNVPSHIGGFRHGGGRLVAFVDKKKEFGDSVKNHLMVSYQDRIATIIKAEQALVTAFD